MTYQIILPSIYQPYTEACLATMHPDLRANTLVWDNTQTNIGVSAAWNKGIEALREKDGDWLIIISATMRFGREGGLDLIRKLETTNLFVAEPEMGHMWHLMSIHRSVIDRVGTFDENFFAYYEDTDYAKRIRLSHDHKFRWAKILVDVSSMGNCHSQVMAGLVLDTSKSQQRYINKWGGMPGQERFDHPFNDASKDVSYWVKEN